MSNGNIGLYVVLAKVFPYHFKGKTFEMFGSTADYAYLSTLALARITVEPKKFDYITSEDREILETFVRQLKDNELEIEIAITSSH